MAPLSFSPPASISSHTLSAASAQPPAMDLPPSTTANGYSTAITTNGVNDTTLTFLSSPLVFLTPTLHLNNAFLQAAKQYLDPIAAGVSEARNVRLREMRKRKRGIDRAEDVEVMRLKKVYVEGFGTQGVFEQVRRVVEGVVGEVEGALPVVDARAESMSTEIEEEMQEASDPEEDDDEDSLGEEGVDWEYDGVNKDSEDEAFDDTEMVTEDEDMDMHDDNGVLSRDEEEDDELAETYRADPNGLNDGFFSIDDFNRQTDFLEQQDQRGEVADSDDEEVDWAADPMAVKPTNGTDLDMAQDGLDDESNEGGPTFGNVNLNAPEGDSDDDAEFEDGDLDGLDDGMNANNVMYADFFAPPARKVGKNKKKRGRPNAHNFPEKQEGTVKDNKEEEEAEEEEDVEIEGTMARVQRDLFEDDDDLDTQSELSDVDPSDPKSRRSTHERRQAKLTEEIRKLEAANVAKRSWQLSGEARAADRPLNSLLEENLDFERAGKPIPIITAETSEDIEALIKRRILAGEFDEVLRRRPDDLATGPKVRRGAIELADTKSSKGLAEIYEEEHLRATDPAYLNTRDESLKKQHDEINALWTTISAKLDSLSSAHYKPRPVTANLEIRVDAPAIEIEDARPTAGGEVAGASMLAPQEIYKPGGNEGPKTEIVTKSGMPVAREEMSREEKKGRRRRAKERSRKAGSNDLAASAKTKGGASEKEKNGKRGGKKGLVADLKKGGVQVIGRKGVVTDVEGKEVSGGAKRSGGSWKL